MSVHNLLFEFDRQVALLRKSEVISASDKIGVERELSSLRDRVSAADPATISGNIELCLVVNTTPFPAARLMDFVTVKGARGLVEMTPHSPESYKHTDDVQIPSSKVYLLWDIDTGRAGLNRSPEHSLKTILDEGRTPLTLEEGVMVALFYPEIFTDKKQYNNIQMPGSRTGKDQTIPSIWFSKGAPRLGWCWDRNVHTWLATASGGTRIAP